MFPQFCGCRIVSIHIPDLTEDLSLIIISFFQNSLCVLFLMNEAMLAVITLFHHPVFGSSNMFHFLIKGKIPTYGLISSFSASSKLIASVISLFQYLQFYLLGTFYSAIVFKDFLTLNKKAFPWLCFSSSFPSDLVFLVTIKITQTSFHSFFQLTHGSLCFFFYFSSAFDIIGYFYSLT